MKSLLSLDRWIARCERVTAVSLLSLTVCIVILQVFFRYVLNSSLSWSEEAARYLFIWASVLGFSSCIESRRLFSFDSVAVSLPLIGQKICKLLYVFSVIVFLWVLIYHGNSLVSLTMTQSSPAIGLPMAFAYAALPIGGVLMTLHFLAAWWESATLSKTT